MMLFYCIGHAFIEFDEVDEVWMVHLLHYLDLVGEGLHISSERMVVLEDLDGDLLTVLSEGQLDSKFKLFFCL